MIQFFHSWEFPAESVWSVNPWPQWLLIQWSSDFFFAIVDAFDANIAIIGNFVLIAKISNTVIN